MHWMTAPVLTTLDALDDCTGWLPITLGHPLSHRQAKPEVASVAAPTLLATPVKSAPQRPAISSSASCSRSCASRSTSDTATSACHPKLAIDKAVARAKWEELNNTPRITKEELIIFVETHNCVALTNVKKMTGDELLEKIGKELGVAGRARNWKKARGDNNWAP